MDATGIALQPVLVLLASSVLAVVACRSLSLPPIVGYLVTGLVLGPHALGLIEDSEETRRLAEFGVVFLMFSIGLEFSLPRLLVMRRVVFGLGLVQVSATIALSVLASVALGGSWQAGLVLGGAAAMSSTAIVSKLLAERMELDSPHGRQIIGVLLFQDLAVVPLLILVPALGHPAGEAGVKAGGASKRCAASTNGRRGYVRASGRCYLNPKIPRPRLIAWSTVRPFSSVVRSTSQRMPASKLTSARLPSITPCGAGASVRSSPPLACAARPSDARSPSIVSDAWSFCATRASACACSVARYAK